MISATTIVIGLLGVAGLISSWVFASVFLNAFEALTTHFRRLNEKIDILIQQNNVQAERWRLEAIERWKRRTRTKKK